MVIKRSAVPVNPSLILCGLSILLAGCATLFAPDSDTITIQSNPEDALVYSGAQLLGKTPLAHAFNRETFEQKKLEIRKEGYKTRELLLGKAIEEKSLFNFGFFLTTMGASSWGIDAATGNMIKYSPDSYLIDLEKSGDSSSQHDLNREERFRFVVTNQSQLMKEISAGDGEFLKAYFESRPSGLPSDDYQAFLRHVSDQSVLLLSTAEPIDFYKNLEKILNGIEQSEAQTLN